MGLMSIEVVPIDPEVMVPVDWPIFQYVSGALRGCADVVSEGWRETPGNVERGIGG